MSLEDQLYEALKIVTNTLNRIDAINKKLITALIVAIIVFPICFTITVVSMTYLYFRTDYPYGTINQTQTGNSQTSANITLGGVE